MHVTEVVRLLVQEGELGSGQTADTQSWIILIREKPRDYPRPSSGQATKWRGFCKETKWSQDKVVSYGVVPPSKPPS